MSIGATLTPGRVLCNVEARSKKHSLDILSQLIASAGDHLEKGEVFDCLVSREKLGCTAMEDGVAIPHGKMAGLEHCIGAFVCLSNPVDFDTFDQEPVDLIFGLLVPEDSADNYREDLREVALALKDPGFCASLRQAGSSRALYDLLAREEVAESRSA